MVILVFISEIYRIILLNQKINYIDIRRNIMNLKKGEINTKEFVDTFGTEKQKQSYVKNKRLGGRDKELLLNKANKFCHIEDLGQGKYIIHKIYGVKKEDLILPLKKGLYNYLTPLILSKLVDEYYQNNNFKITLPFLGWAKKFEIVNENYSLIKYHQDVSSLTFEIDKDIMFEYFEKMDDCIRYYMQECLSELSKASGLNLIEFDSIKMVRKQKLVYEENQQGGLDITTEEWDEVISDEDRKYVYACEEKAAKKAGITENKEKFYGVKSFIYSRELKELLKKKDILFTYSAFNIYCKNIDNIKTTLKKFADVNLNDNKGFVEAFNEKFIEYIDKKAKGIHKKELKKVHELNIDEKYIKEYRKDEGYIITYNKLSDLTIKTDTPSIKDKIGIKDNDPKSIMEKFNINIVSK